MQNNFNQYIKNSLYNHEIIPPNDAWENIQMAIKSKRKTALVFPWRKWMFTAVSLALPLILGVWLWNNSNENIKVNNDNTEKSITPFFDSESDKLIKNNSEKPDNQYQNNQVFLINNNSEVYETIDYNYDNLVSLKPTQFRLINDNKHNTNDNSLWNRISFWVQKNIIFSNEDKRINDSNEYFVMENETFYDSDDDYQESSYIDEDKLLKDNRLEINPYIHFGYLGSLTGENLISDQLDMYKTQNKIALTYGAKAIYSINDRLKLRSGMGVINLSQETSDIYFSSSQNINNDYLINYNDINVLNENEILLNSQDKFKGNLQHKLRIVEIPMELEYKITENKKANLYATTGLSALFVNKNDVYLQESDEKVLFAKATNINDVSFSANAGIKLDYKLSDNLSVNIEPQLKYMVNTIKGNETARPYIVGVNAGLSYSL